MSEDVFKFRDKSVNYNVDIGEDYTLDFTILIEYRGGTPEIAIDFLEVENDLSYDQIYKMSQIIAKEAYRLGKEEKGGKDE